jgi:hypothetical protein
MKPFQEIREQADRVRCIPLEIVLHLLGAERDRHDRAKWHTARGVISVNGMKFINWNRGLGGGGAIDLAIHLKELDFKAAVEWLWSHFSSSSLDVQDQSSSKSSLRLPVADAGNLARVIDYLVRERDLGSTLIQSLIDSGCLYADKRGNAVFLLLGADGRPVGAELRGTSQVPWRGMALGSQKDLGYFSTLAPHTSSIVICESAIDALSCYSIYLISQCISTAGARPNPLWLKSLLEKGNEVFCGFDADPTGDEIAQAMMAIHPTVKRMRPNLKDWNEVLKSRS